MKYLLPIVLLCSCTWLKTVWRTTQRGETFELTIIERRAIGTIFGTAIDLDKVRLVYDAPASLGSTRTVGNTIHFARKMDITKDRTSARYWRTLFHESCHVLQYQRFGAAYVVDALGPQFEAHRKTGRRGNAYLYKLHSYSRLRQYNGEQQCQIVEDLIGGAPSYCLNCDHDWQDHARRIVGEMR